MKRYPKTVTNASMIESIAACRRMEQALCVCSDHYRDQKEAADRLDRGLTVFLAVLGGVAALGLAGACSLVFLLF